MPYANMSFEQSEVGFRECLGNQSHSGMYFYFVAISDSDTGTFLTTML